MELEQKREVEYLRRDLYELEKEEAELLRQLERVRAKKSVIAEKMTDMTDEEYQQDVLARLYEQRKAEKNGENYKL